jgi:hypothetical protein
VKTCSKCHAAKDESLFNPMPRGPTRLRSYCKACGSAQSRAWAGKNKAAADEHKRAWAAQNREQTNSRARSKFAESPAVAERIAEWRRINRHKVAPLTARRRASKKNATPAWADPARIAAVYRFADACRRAGIDCQVDHLVPLQSPLVCGLHTHHNLAVMATPDNQAKSNRIWPDQASTTNEAAL